MLDLHERLLRNDTALTSLEGTYFLGAAISAGASLIGGLFGKSSEESRDRKNRRAQDAVNERNLAAAVAMNADVRRRAEAAAAVPIVTTSIGSNKGGLDTAGFLAASDKLGLNKVSMMRAGALSLFATTDSYHKETVTGSRAMDAALAGQYLFQEPSPTPVTARGTGEVIGNALTAGANTYLEGMAADRQNQFQLDLLQKQLDGYNRNNALSQARRSALGGNSPGNIFGNTPKAFLSGSVTKNSADKNTTNGLPNLFVDYWDNSAAGGGRRVSLPNPDIADSEQLAAAMVAMGYKTAQDWNPIPGVTPNKVTTTTQPRTTININLDEAFKPPKGSASWYDWLWATGNQ